MASASREQNSSAGAPDTEQLKMDHRVAAQSPPSDNDSERPVRQQLKKTNLGAVGENNGSARPNRKRSLDDTDGANDTPPIKRSRECTPDILHASTEATSDHTGTSNNGITQNVSDNVLATPANTTHETTKVHIPLGVEIKVSIAGSEKITRLSIPLDIDVKVHPGVVSLVSETSRSAEDESPIINTTIPSAERISRSGNPYPGHTSPGHPSLEHTSLGHTSLGHASLGDTSSGHASSGHVSSGHVSGHAFRNASYRYATSGHASGHASSGHAASGHAISGHVSSRHVSGHASGHASSGNASSGRASYGYATSGHASSGNVSSGNVSSGNVSSGNVSGHASRHASYRYATSGHASGHASSGHASSGPASSGHASSGKHVPSEDYIPLEDPESSGDSSSEDSLPDYRSPEFPTSPSPVPRSPTHPDYPRPMVEIIDPDRYKFPQNIETTAGGNEDGSSQTLKKKRSREQLEDDVSKNSHAITDPTPGLAETTSSDEKSTAEGQPEKKRPRDNSEERKAKVDQTFTASAFGKASANPSPFAMPAAKSTSDASPFATSGASTTGLGALGTGFSGFGSAFPAPSGKLTSFASSNAPAAFPGATGKLTSFASANAPASFSGTAGKLTSFASPNAPVSFGNSSDKTLGAKQSDNEESDNEAAGEANDTFVAEKTDERFHQQTGMDPSLQRIPRKPELASRSSQVKKPVETGEENETTKFTSKGKLYYFANKKWKERGIGTFKVNLKTDSHGKQSGRMIMRADGALRVMLNSAIWQTMPFGDNKGDRPATRDIYLASKDGEKVVSLLLRLSNEKPAQELYDVLKHILEKI